jgi:hypothetical protein
MEKSNTEGECRTIANEISDEIKKSRSNDSRKKTQWYINLTHHIRKMSVEKVDVQKMFAEWRFHEIEDNEDGNGDCPCGKTHIRYECKLRNRKTHRLTHVGSRCIQRFVGQDALKDLVQMAQRYMSDGIRLTYFGVDPKYGKQRFIVNGNAAIVSLKTKLDVYFDYKLPLFCMGNGKWLLSVFRNPYASSLNLTKGHVAMYRLRASTYEFLDRIGLCFHLLPIKVL